MKNLPQKKLGIKINKFSQLIQVKLCGNIFLHKFKDFHISCNFQQNFIWYWKISTPLADVKGKWLQGEKQKKNLCAIFL